MVPFTLKLFKAVIGGCFVSPVGELYVAFITFGEPVLFIFKLTIVSILID